jgi:hypothetical protein
MTISASQAPTPTSARGTPRRWLRWLMVAGVVLLILLLLAPTMLVKLGLLQTLLNGRLAAHDIQASIGQAQLGWMTPTAFRDVRIADTMYRWQFSVAELGSELSLWQLLTTRGDLGTFVIDQPTIVVSMDEPIQLPKFPANQDPWRRNRRSAREQFRILMKDGTILVRVRGQEQPLEFARHINLQADWQKTHNQRLLTIAQGRPLDHVQLTPEMCDTGLKYVAPIFGDVAWTKGTLSLDLDECRIPLDQPITAVVLGRVSLHEVETGLKNPLAKDIARLVATATRRELPDSVRLADSSVVEFQVHDGQVHHSGLEFGLPKVAPELVIRTQGTVGFDRQLDLIADIPLPMQLLGDGPLAQSLGNQTLHLPIRGSLDQPQLKLEGDGKLASELIAKLLDPVVAQQVKPSDVIDALRRMRTQQQDRREQRGPLFPRLRDRFRGGRDDVNP